MKIIYPKHCGFEKGHSTDHALLELVDHIYNFFERNEYKIGAFIELSKAFDTIDHNILLKKNKNLCHIWHATSSVVSKLLKQQETLYSVWWLAKNKLQNCVMRCSTRIHFRTFPFILCIKDLKFTSDLLFLIIFVEDTIFFYSNKECKRWIKVKVHCLRSK